MKVVVHPDETGNPELDVYLLQAGGTYFGSPDSTIICGNVHLGSSYHSKFVIGSNGTIYALTNNGKDIIRFAPPVPDGASAETIYQHSTFIRHLQLRSVQGKERLYFSAQAPSTPDDPNRARIFWLDDTGAPHQYWEVGKTDLLVPNPCSPGTDFALFYAGDFTFGDNDTLYLSNGNSSPCGIFRVSGAGPASVSGTPERIFQTDAFGMSDLHYDGEGGLLFTDYSSDAAKLPYRLHRFDIATKSTEIIWNLQGKAFRSFAVYPTAQLLHWKFPILKKKNIEKIPKIPRLNKRPQYTR